MKKDKEYVVAMACEVTFYFDIPVVAGSKAEAGRKAAAVAETVQFEWDQSDQAAYRIVEVVEGGEGGQ